jgi:murein DD-endopeptidase MepM/ murein hydrolase activator NlpD
MGQKLTLALQAEEPQRGIEHIRATASGASLPQAQIFEEAAFAVGSAWFVDDSGATMKRWSKTIELDAKTLGLREGTFEVELVATGAPTWRTGTSNVSPSVPMAQARMLVTVDHTAPTLQARSTFVHVAQGGAELVVYDAGADAVVHGVRVTSSKADAPAREHPGVRLPDGRCVALFAIDYDETGPEAAVIDRVRLFVRDDVGNEATQPFIHKFMPRAMGKDTIALNDAFIRKVIADIGAPGGDNLATYLAINGDMRRDNNATLRTLGMTSSGKMLWKDVFQPFGDAAIKGAFADRRTYQHGGADVDTQDHLGFDLARTERAPVNAGNDGVVVHAARLGIYGNCVVIDHGWGLMTLYAHLSSIDVGVGANVTRGQIIGKTGATGLAGGDHLHFTTMIHGQPVNPIEWWDDHWIEDRVRRKLREAAAVAPP